MDEDSTKSYCTPADFDVDTSQEIILGPTNAVAANKIELIFAEGKIAHVADVKLNHVKMEGYTCVKEFGGGCLENDSSNVIDTILGSFMTISECAQLCMNNKKCSGFLYTFNAAVTDVIYFLYL